MACCHENQIWETGAEMKGRSLFQLPAIGEMGDFFCPQKPFSPSHYKQVFFIRTERENRTKKSGEGNVVREYKGVSGLQPWNLSPCGCLGS